MERRAGKGEGSGEGALVTEQVLAEVSVYPLRQSALGPAVEAAIEALREAGLEPSVGPMGTGVRGDSKRVFDALRRAFEAAGALGDVVMTARISNACGRE